MMEYKGYVATVEYDDAAAVFHGEIVNTRDVITFQGRSVDDLRRALRDSIEDYLAWCRQRGKEPEKPFSGKFMVRLGPEVHRRITLAAREEGKSLNAWAAERLAAAAASGLGPPKSPHAGRARSARQKRSTAYPRTADGRSLRGGRRQN